jgi:hypothetical protein
MASRLSNPSMRNQLVICATTPSYTQPDFVCAIIIGMRNHYFYAQSKKDVDRDHCAYSNMVAYIMDLVAHIGLCATKGGRLWQNLYPKKI